MIIYTKDSAAKVKQMGFKAVKTSITHFLLIEHAAKVVTEEGDILVSKAPFLLATDGERVWPVDMEYFKANYRKEN